MKVDITLEQHLSEVSRIVCRIVVCRALQPGKACPSDAGRELIEVVSAVSTIDSVLMHLSMLLRPQAPLCLSTRPGK